MQTFNTVRLEDKLLFPNDMVSVVSVVSSVPVASASIKDTYVFLKETCTVDLIIGGVVAGTQVLQSGKIYKCKLYTWIDPGSGIASTEYKWTNVSFAENGKLEPCTNTDFTFQENAIKDGGGWSVIIHWEDPVDIINGADPSLNAVWEYSIIVRKLGTERPKTVNDGDIVGFSSIRNQYQSKLSFIDFVPESNYSYNIFAVTRYGVATGLDDSGGSEVDWVALRQSIWNGSSGLSLGATIPVHHDQYGTLTLQVVDMRVNDTSLVNPSPLNRDKRSVVFMAYTPLPRSAYDVPEHASVGVEENPGDKTDAQEDKCSTSGHCLWAYSNLRQWLNQDEWVKTEDTFIDINKTYGIKLSDGTYEVVKTPVASELPNYYEYVYVKSTDERYKINKCYYIRTGEGTTINPYVYKPVPTPLYPDRVNPSELGYYDATWKWRPRVTGTVTELNKWDKMPQPFDASNPDAGYSYNNRALPGFLCGFSAAFRTVLATVNVNTITDPFFYAHGGSVANRHQTTPDKVFIPSYREIFGEEPPGIRSDKKYKDAECQEGKQFPFYNPSITIPDLTLKDRSPVKLDEDGGLCGYWLRSIETVKAPGAASYGIASASGLWRIGSDFTTKPDLGDQNVTSTYKCKMSVADSRATGVSGNYVAPGVAWCVVIG